MENDEISFSFSFLLMNEELIAAIATAEGRGGIAIVRVSGEGAYELAKRIFRHRGELEPNMLYPGELDCGEFTDYGMCVYFRAPRSFTGEDVAEFHCHGGVEIARGVLRRAISLGARLAKRGEFTRRAFLNGKLSLSAAEGMADMINAQSLSEVRAGYLLYGERLSREGKALQNSLKACLASVEADVDFPEEDLESDSRREIEGRLKEVEEALEALTLQYRAGKKIKEGVGVAICGRPNAGKSSLLNALVGYDRAIVSSVPGTTRDTVDASIEIGGVLFRLTDTAGLREGVDGPEREGIRRAREAILSSDVIVYLREEGDEVDFPAGTPVITVGAKCDLGERKDCEIAVSSFTGEGIEALKQRIYECGYGAESGVFLMEERHFGAAKEALECVRDALAAVRNGLPSELYAEDLRRAWNALGEFSGETSSEAVIDEIFSKFCVGK